ncbi:hypothetical protein JCM11641_000868 [Rhodosporidiobolus odoratus]
MVAAPVPPPGPRRVSYVLPPPTAPPPLLAFPSLDRSCRRQTSPLFSFTGAHADGVKYTQGEGAHPRHRLPVQALALDLSTSLSHEGELDSAPGGILYTGGRDGLLCSWELGLPTKRRRRRYGQVDPEEEDSDESDSSEEEGDDDALAGSLDLTGTGPRNRLGTVPAPTGPKRRSSSSSAATTRQVGGSGASGQEEEVPMQDQWEVDEEAMKRSDSPPKTRFRSCIQSHTDWVNDIVLTNHNRTLVSASSDSLVLAWNPHSSDQHDQVTPTTIGRHGDYVRCLASPKNGRWVASGGFDRKVKLWDMGEGRSGSDAMLELPSPPGSVYSLGTTPSGSLVAAGTPERVVRIWDTRSRKQVSRLGGHTDNVRAVLLSDDGRWVLSASSDSTVKLFSLAAQKALHTFSHHSTAVWSLFSQHPNLEVFYSGDRVGNVCKIDLEDTGDPADGECVLLSRDGPEDGESRAGHEGITQLVAQDDSWVWTASGSSSVKRWRDIPTKAQRVGAILRKAQEGGESVLPEEQRVASPVPVDSVLPPTDSPASPADSPSQPTFPASPDKDRSTPFSVSFLEDLTSPLGRSSSSPTPRSPAHAPHLSSAGRPSSLRTPRQSIASQSHPRLDQIVPSPSNPTSLCDIPYDSLIPLRLPEDEYFAPAFHQRRDPDAATIHSTVSGTSALGLGLASLHRPHLVSASSSSFRRGFSATEASATNVAQREYLDRESVTEATPLREKPDEVIEGSCGLVRCEILSDRQHALSQDADGDIALWHIVRGYCVGVFQSEQLQQALSKRRPSDADGASLRSTGGGSVHSWREHGFDRLAYIREHIEGEVSVATWCKADTRVGAITIHLEPARVFDAEAYVDECGIEPREDYPSDHRISLGKWVLRQLFDGFVEAEMALRAPSASPAAPSALFGAAGPQTPQYISLATISIPTSPRLRGPRTPGMTVALASPAVKRAVLPELLMPASPKFPSSELQPIPQSPAMPTPLTPRQGGLTPTLERPQGDYFSLLPIASEAPASAPLASPTYNTKPHDPAGTGFAAPPPGLSTPLPAQGGTLMGRLKMLGKGSKRPSTASETPVPATPIATAVVDGRSIEEQQQQIILDTLFAQPLAPCPLLDAPRLQYDPDMAIIISEETGDAWNVKYRGLVGTSFHDMAVLEQKAPFWLLDFLLSNRVSTKEPAKVSFVLQPWKADGEQSLPELPNANARLTANRSLRVRKVCSYVADKLDLRRPSRAPSIMDGASAPPSPRNSPAVGHSLYGDFDPEKEIEILVNGQSLPVNVTLATIRHCMWKGGGDVVLTYRAVQTHEEL